MTFVQDMLNKPDAMIGNTHGCGNHGRSGKKWAIEVREKIRASMKHSWADPKTRARRLAARRKRAPKPEKINVEHLDKFAQMHASQSKHVKNLICSRCKTKVGGASHHIVPRSYGGGDYSENLMALCAKCHDKVEILTDEILKSHQHYTVDDLRGFVLHGFPNEQDIGA